MNNNEISALFFDNSIRAEKVINLAIQCVGDRFSDDVREAFYDNWDNIWKQISCDEPNYQDDEDIACQLVRNKKQGFLIEFATPIPQNIRENSFDSSWGYYTTKWIYAETWQEACELALQWNVDYISAKRKESMETIND